MFCLYPELQEYIPLRQETDRMTSLSPGTKKPTPMGEQIPPPPPGTGLALALYIPQDRLSILEHGDHLAQALCFRAEKPKPREGY